VIMVLLGLGLPVGDNPCLVHPQGGRHRVVQVEGCSDRPMVGPDEIGEVRGVYDHWRTGDHRPAGMLLVRSKGLEPGARQLGLAVEDIGPSLAARLGVEVSNVDGAPAPWLAAFD